MAKRMIALVVLILGAIGFIIGTASPDWAHAHKDPSPHYYSGIYRVCADYPHDCETVKTSDLSDCAQKKGAYAYLPSYFIDNCQKQLAAQAFSMIALVVSAIAVIVFIALRSRPKLATGFALFASFAGVIAMAVWVSQKNASDKTVSDNVSDKVLDWGWGFGLFLVGIICSGVGGILSAVFGSSDS